MSLSISMLARVVLFGCSVLMLTSASVRADGYQPRTFTDGAKSLPYELLVPPGYDKTKKYPVIVFFHGAGERGTDNVVQLKFAPTDVFKTDDFQKAHPCFIIAPQCPPDDKWVEMDWSLMSGVRPPQPSPPMQLALKILDAVEGEFSIDHDRVYVAGLSMGGFATWDLVTRFPARFAAGVPCCGGGDENTVTAEVAKVPVWAFHSADDNVVHVERTRNMIAAMKKMGGLPKYTEYNGLGHGSWGKAFSEPGLYDWLFAQNLTQRPGGTP